jgi:hypothetical protein
MATFILKLIKGKGHPMTCPCSTKAKQRYNTTHSPVSLFFNITPKQIDVPVPSWQEIKTYATVEIELSYIHFLLLLWNQ